MLEQTKIISNTKKYFDTLNNLGVNTDKLAVCLGEEFIKAPANSYTFQPNCFEGGLIDFILNVTKNLISINELLPEPKRIEKNTLVKVGLLFNIGKAKLYILDKDSKYIKKETNLSISEQSIYYAINSGITFTEEEYLAIIHHHDYDDINNKNVIGKLLKIAIELTNVQKFNK